VPDEYELHHRRDPHVEREEAAGPGGEELVHEERQVEALGEG
jgi:hypothetical protein